MEEFDKQSALRAIPPVNDILDNQKVKALIECFGRTLVCDNLKLVIDEYRRNIDESFQNTWPAESEAWAQPKAGTNPQIGVQLKTREEVLEYIADRLKEAVMVFEDCGLKRVINATGVVLHTNLGRAPLPEKAIESMKEAGQGYCNLEFDLESGGRGSRHSHIESVITQITGAESAIIVNNNAAAVFLCLNTFANNREVVVSRGQQVEIGGSFRIPDIIARSGAKMTEVGTTNKTRINDYALAITEETSVLLKVHTSNYKITGFTEETPLGALVGLGKERGLLVIEDLGSGCLFDLSLLGLPYEPTVQDSIKYGADIVTFSGDKLLGGPQAGIIAGKKELIDRLKKNPLTRMVRCDKTTIATTAAVLSLYLDMDTVVEKVPVLKMLSLTEEELSVKAIGLERLIGTSKGGSYKTEIVDELDEVGGGSFPGVVLKGKAVAISVPESSINEIQTRLRKSKTPVICRINKDRILFNVRTIEEDDYPVIAEALAGILE